VCCSKNEVASDAGIRKLVTEQMTQWSEMMERHRKEEWGILKQQVSAREVLFF
jgi:phosphatidylinositol phospholipase C beta